MTRRALHEEVGAVEKNLSWLAQPAGHQTRSSVAVAGGCSIERCPPRSDCSTIQVGDRHGGASISNVASRWVLQRPAVGALILGGKSSLMFPSLLPDDNRGFGALNSALVRPSQACSGCLLVHENSQQSETRLPLQRRRPDTAQRCCAMAAWPQSLCCKSSGAVKKSKRPAEFINTRDRPRQSRHCPRLTDDCTGKFTMSSPSRIYIYKGVVMHASRGAECQPCGGSSSAFQLRPGFRRRRGN